MAIREVFQKEREMQLFVVSYSDFQNHFKLATPQAPVDSRFISSARTIRAERNEPYNETGKASSTRHYPVHIVFDSEANSFRDTELSHCQCYCLMKNQLSVNIHGVDLIHSRRALLVGDCFIVIKLKEDQRHFSRDKPISLGNALQKLNC